MNKHDIVLYHAPQTRGTGVWFLLEELGAPYDMKVLDRSKGENHQPDFHAINPLGKFPTVVHNGSVITEQVACFIYLADLFPEKGLAPALDDPKRAAYLRWMAFQGSSFEPAIVDHAFKRAPIDPVQLPYGSYDQTLKTLFDQLSKGPYLLGDKPYAVDLLWGMTLHWCRMFGLFESNPTVDAYIERIASRPAFISTTEQDQVLADQQTTVPA